MRLFRLIVASVFLVIGVLVLAFFIDAVQLTVLLLIPLYVYITYLFFRVRSYRRKFKPSVVNLILEFISSGLNYGDITYAPEGKISKNEFLASRLFTTKAPYYDGEDYIQGRVGEMDFALCELDVRDYSPIGNQLDSIFKGFFVSAVFNEHTEGELVMWPVEQRPYITRSIKGFTRTGGTLAAHEVNYPGFNEVYLVYAGRDTHVEGILTMPMQQAILQRTATLGKPIYFSVQDQRIYCGIPKEQDMLEPHFFRTVVSYDLILGFYLDISLAIQLIEDFDQMH